jgi:hypothetical protein
MIRQQDAGNDQEECPQKAVGLLEANPRTDGIMERDTGQSGTAILDDQEARLNRAIDTWTRLGTPRGAVDGLDAPLDGADIWIRSTGIEKDGYGQLPRPQPPDALTTRLAPAKNPSTPESRDKLTPPNPTNPTVIRREPCDSQQWWERWGEERAVHDRSALDLARPTRWWMQEEDHYGLCQPREQSQLESSARVVRFNGTSAPAGQSHR